MLANASSLLTLNPLIVYATLGLYGLLFASMFLFLHSQSRRTDRVFQTLKTEWNAADSRHVGLVESAQESFHRLAAQPARVAAHATQASVTVDTRTQVVAMAKRGLPVLDIARSCGLAEGEVDVLLGMARMQQR